MNIDRARSEPFYQFHRSYEAVSLHMRVIVAGLAELKDKSERNKASGTLTLLDTDGEPWSPSAWKDLSRPISAAKRFSSQLGIVQVITALEDFCIGVKAERDRFAAVKGLAATAIKEDESGEGIPPRKLYNVMGWDTGVLDTLDPVYDYFCAVRNCIAHRSGRASKKLVAAAAASSLQQCLATWHGKDGKRVPPLPAITAHEDVAVLPRHVILASEACGRITQDTNAKLITFLGTEGIVYMAAHHSLLSGRPLKTEAWTSPEAMLHVLLANRYQVKLSSETEAIQVLKKLDKWKQYKRTFEKGREQTAL